MLIKELHCYFTRRPLVQYFCFRCLLIYVLHNMITCTLNFYHYNIIYIFDCIFIESNSKVVLEALSKSELEIQWRIHNTCSDMYFLLSQSLNIFVNWVSRNSNGVTHTMAKKSLKHNSFNFFWYRTFSPCFESIIKVEATSPSTLIISFFPLKNEKKKHVQYTDEFRCITCKPCNMLMAWTTTINTSLHQITT